MVVVLDGINVTLSLSLPPSPVPRGSQRSPKRSPKAPPLAHYYFCRVGWRLSLFFFLFYVWASMLCSLFQYESLSFGILDSLSLPADSLPPLSLFLSLFFYLSLSLLFVFPWKLWLIPLDSDRIQPTRRLSKVHRIPASKMVRILAPSAYWNSLTTTDFDRLFNPNCGTLCFEQY